jgi:hypothetical protein
MNISLGVLQSGQAHVGSKEEKGVCAGIAYFGLPVSSLYMNPHREQYHFDMITGMIPSRQKDYCGAIPGVLSPGLAEKPEDFKVKPD